MIGSTKLAFQKVIFSYINSFESDIPLNYVVELQFSELTFYVGKKDAPNFYRISNEDKVK